MKSSSEQRPIDESRSFFNCGLHIVITIISNCYTNYTAMKNIILFTLLSLSFNQFIYAQVVEKYIDKNNASTTVIEKEPRSDDEEVLNTLDINDYGVGQEIYIIDHRKLEQERQQEETIVVEQVKQERISPNNTASQVKSDFPERNPIGVKVKRKRKRTPRWKSVRRGKRSNSTCFKF